ncbi:hypothetical protein JDV02_000976 [Purpureocillium takamizusanense]|uniref:LPXTG-motif cell wall anchor domain protein n=1 Tax=Purpureocillium takamizusanense TaxID=2060973 RepID=A0A9Q8Q875_9HYPO|nr:uncharacterized protein JDV02_000976 [Purpureocillium takamizusanense]UNI14339.1 hypothetical protein JDV02_000976 [Purpureocillium takamizusanense]
MTDTAGFTTAGPHAAAGAASAQISQPHGGIAANPANTTTNLITTAATAPRGGPKTLAVTAAAAAASTGAASGTTTAGATAGTNSGTAGPALCNVNLQQPATTTTTTKTASTDTARTKLPHLTTAATTATTAASSSPSVADRGTSVPRHDAAIDSDNSTSDDTAAAAVRRISASLKHPHRPAHPRLRDHRPAGSRGAHNEATQDSDAAPLSQQHSGPRHQRPSRPPSLPVSPVSPPPQLAGPTTSSPTDQGPVYAALATADDQAECDSSAIKDVSDLVQEQQSTPLYAAAGSSRDTPGQSSSPSRTSTGRTSATTSRPTSTDDCSASPASAGRSSKPSRPSSSSDAHSAPAAAVDDSQQPARPPARRAPASRSSHGVPTAAGPPPSLDTQRRHAADFASQPSPGGSTTSPSDIQGPRELLLPKRLSQSSSSDESRHSTSNRPPISYKPPPNVVAAQSGASTPVRVPPIRGFRSSGSRKSLALDMNYRPRPYDLGDDSARGTNDNTLRALEGRYSDDSRRSSTLSPARQNSSPGNFDDTGDVFFHIARDEPNHRPGDEHVAADDVQSSVSRLHRSAHRRPLSTAVASYPITSPPRLQRRLSDQQDRPRMRNADEEQTGEVSRAVNYRNLTREKASSAHPAEDVGRARAGSSSLRPSPLALRPMMASQEPRSEPSVYARRRASITENNSTVGARSSAYKAAVGSSNHGKSYSSSPLARTFDSHTRDPAQGGVVEGTESTASTTAPSTVWDELDDLKSRIHRLELTGKLPSTSGAAVSRLTDERPATATTTVTTMSLSPKRQPGAQASEPASTTPSQREAHPILVSALVKSKPFMSPDVYRALESAANDAINLSSMMGVPGQPGPISSGLSVVGSGGNVTDRQLRRKADSVCRSLTELCVALGEDVTLQPRLAPPAQVNMSQVDGPATPTMPKTYSGLPAPRRQSLAADQNLSKPVGGESPRAMSKFEERRNHLLNGTPLSIPRPSPAAAPMSADVNVNRRSSLLVARTRRATTEEPDDGRASSLLRTRRAGTEEVDEGRRTSLLVRNRRGTVGEERDEGRFQAPSRAATEVNLLRGYGREYAQDTQVSPPDTSGQSADLARRRLTSTSFRTSRLAVPTGSGPAPPRRYLEKSTVDRDVSSHRQVEEYGTRQPGSSPATTHTRASSMGTRRNRDSIVSAVPSSATTAGTYR